MRILKLCMIALALAAAPAPLVVGCSYNSARVVTEGDRPDALGDYAPAVRSEAIWRLLAARPGTELIARAEVVKVIIDRSDGEVYFLESKRWPLHFFFADRFLNKPDNPIPEQAAFNISQYRQDDRRFVLGTVSHYLDADRWVFDLFAGDTLSLESTAEAFKKIKERVFFGDALAYRPVPPQQERAIDRARALMPIVTTDEIFGKVRYQPLELGEAYGYLKVVAKGAAFDPSSLRPYDIIVLAEQPEDIPVVAGVITDQIQAPLGHINVLCHNRKTPNMALRDASTSDEIRALDGKLVRLVVTPQAHTIEPASQAQAEASWAQRRPAQGFRPERDDSDVGFPLLRELDRGDIKRVGAKTAQLAVAARLLPPGVTPQAFALPFSAYARFLQQNGLDVKLTAMLDDPAFQRDPEVRRVKLEAFRAEIMAGAVSEDLIAALTQKIRASLPPGRVRFRSSTNAEDLPGFNGAGLYRSTRVTPDKPGDIARGLREVWASTWLWAAFEEREYYRIDHHTVGMAVLVQQSIDDDTGNGVAITANPFSQGNPGFFINAQVSGGSVTGAKGDEVPEQVLYYTYDTGRGFQRLSRSSRAKGGVVMDDATVEELVDHLSKIHAAFTGDPFGASGRAVDVEFLIRREAPKVIIVQARPYTVTWSSDRLWRRADGSPVMVE